MKNFKYVQELEEWLDSLSYDQFWQEMAEIGCDADARAQMDQQISDGIVDEATALSCMKAATRLDLINELGLEYRDDMPILLNENSYF